MECRQPARQARSICRVIIFCDQRYGAHAQVRRHAPVRMEIVRSKENTTYFPDVVDSYHRNAYN